MPAPSSAACGLPLTATRPVCLLLLVLLLYESPLRISGPPEMSLALQRPSASHPLLPSSRCSLNFDERIRSQHGQATTLPSSRPSSFLNRSPKCSPPSSGSSLSSLSSLSPLASLSSFSLSRSLPAFVPAVLRRLPRATANDPRSRRSVSPCGSPSSFSLTSSSLLSQSPSRTSPSSARSPSSLPFFPLLLSPSLSPSVSPSIPPSPLSPSSLVASPSPLFASLSSLPAPTTPVTPLPFALFKEANTWVESLIATHIVHVQRRGRRNEPPREGPSLNWDLLADGRILKRQIEGGEGALYPSPQMNVTIEFSLHTLSGFKIADTRALNTTMMEFPFADAMPGMQIALASMRKLERSVFLLSPEMGLPFDFSVDLELDKREDDRRQQTHDEDLPPSLRDARRREEMARTETSPANLTSYTVRGGDWLAFDITLCNIYDRHRPWWRISPDMEFLKNLPEEHIPDNMTHDEWLEYKADQVRDKIQDEMSTNPASPYWDDIEPAMNDVQRERVQNYTTRLYGLDTPPDPRRDGSRGFRDSVLGRSGGMRHGCEMGDRMMGKSKHYVWRESVFNFEIVLFVRDGIRAEHVTWHITSKRLDIFFGGKRVFGDEFVHPIDHGEGATWTLTEAATKQQAMPLSELHALYTSAPLDVPARLDLPNAPLQSSVLRKASGPTAYDFPQPQPIGQLPEESTSYTCPTLLSTLKGQLEDLKLPLHQPAMHINLPKASNWREMWGNPFKFV